jgi:hypothetical protein
MLKRIKDRGKQLEEKLGVFRSIRQSSSPNPESANVITNTRSQASNNLAHIHRTDQASGTATPTMPDPSNQSQPTKPDQTNCTQANEQGLTELTVRVPFVSSKLPQN